MRFSDETLQAFCQMSHDRNPLHTDEMYSRRTQFGRPVVYGMAAVLMALGQWSRGRVVRLERLKVQFPKAMFADEDFDLSLNENRNQVAFKVSKGGVTRVSGHWTWSEVAGHSVLNAPAFRPLSVAEEIQSKSVSRLNQDGFFYVPGPVHDLSGFGLSNRQLPFLQLATLLGSSYLVGMVLPGKQALFSYLNVEFDAQEHNALKLNFNSIEWDDRFNKYTLIGAGPGIKSLDIQAFVRPPPPDYAAGEISDAAGHSDLLNQQNVLVTGASRGFGAILAQMLAGHGARVGLVYKKGHGDAERIVAQIRAQGGDATALQFDRIAEFGRVDILVNNACPALLSHGFLEMPSAEFSGFISDTIKLVTTPTRTFLPAMKAGGLVVNISTQHTQKGAPGFAHYVTAKAAVEGLTKSLSWEFPKHRFVLARPPRMKTDMSNLVYDPLPSQSPVEVGAALVRRLLDLSPEGGYYEIDL